MAPLGSHSLETTSDLFRATLTKPIKASGLLDVLVSLFASVIEKEIEEEQLLAYDPTMGTRLPLKILLAEDNKINQRLATIILKRLGYEAKVAVNGLDVIEAVKQESYDVILMDIQMPEMDGLDATRVVRSMELHVPQPYIIAVSANVMTEDREAAELAGVDGYVSKPIQVEELVAALENAALSRR